MSHIIRPLLPLAALLLCLHARADVTMRPNEKPKETTRDFIKDQKKNGFVSPEPSNGEGKFVVGQSVQVELKVSTADLGFVQFVIREQPKHGTLSAIRPHPSGESNRAVVTYTHNGNPEELADRFTFAARAGESSTSAPGIIYLTGRRAEANLQVLDPPHFKQLKPGESDTVTVVVKNIGNAAFSGDLKLPAPFVGPAHFDVAVNEKLTLMIMATPQAPGTYRLDQELQPGQAGSRLRAALECAQPFVVTPGSLNLTFDPFTGQRKGTVKVSNGSDAPLNLKVECNKRLQVNKDLYLDPKAINELVITLPKEDVAAFHSELSISQDPSRQKVMINADPAPAHLVLQSPKDGKLDFGQIIKGKVPEVKVTVLNDGGVPAILQASQTPPFMITTDFSSMKVEPGKTGEVVVTFNPDLPGNYTQPIFLAGNAGRLELTAKGAMTDPARPNGGVSTAGGAHGGIRPHDTDVVPARPNVSRPGTGAGASVKSTEPPPVMVSRPMPQAPTPAPVVAAAPAPAASPPAPGAHASQAGSKPQPQGPSSFKEMSPMEVARVNALMSYGISPLTLPQVRSSSLEPMGRIGVLERNRDNVVLIWEPNKIQPKEYIVERAYLVRNSASGLMLKTWKTTAAWSFEKGPDPSVVTARIKDLKPDNQYEFRVFAMDKDNRFSEPTSIVQVVTLSPFRMPSWAWQSLAALLFLALVYAGYQWKQGDWQPGIRDGSKAQA